ncbi:MAG TPA: PQQ-dependent sugar dehydrogenase [Nitrososphaeraceae archaeon]|nr:PQQ-dependent sugar dehydrogenase [Nitrososphaeraceae archaeon]
MVYKLKFLMPRFTSLSSSLFCITSIIVVVAFLVVLTCTSIANRIPHFILLILQPHYHSHFAKALVSKYSEVGLPSPKGPTIADPHLKAQVIFRGLKYPTSMAFLGPNDMLVTEKDSGTVRRIVNGTQLQQPLLNVSVATYGHRGMLGIAIAPHPSTPPTPAHRNPNVNHNNTTADNEYIFLYYTQAQTHTSDDITEGKQPTGNYLYRYELSDNKSKLVNPKVLLDLPAIPGAIGNGGKVIIGADNNVYITIGDVGIKGHTTKAQNIQNGGEPDGTSGILTVDQNGKPIKQSILGNKFPLSLYFSYGIWNSFGLAFDPMTGNLWDTQIGLPYGDEINLVNPGFNSGYNKIDGVWLRGYGIDQATEKQHIAPVHPTDLVDFAGNGKYHPPQFTWFRKVVPTGITFLNSNKLGNLYKNDMFVGDAKYGNIYHFKLNIQRTGLVLPPGPIADGIANSYDSVDQIVFGKGFGGITDIKFNPYDGYLYVLAFDGTIYRIVVVANK